jgi:hypothetical protein
MGADVVGKIAEFLTKVSPRIFGALFLFCLIIVLLPANVLTTLNLRSFVDVHRAALALALIGSGAYLATFPLHAIWKQAAALVVTFLREKQTIRLGKKHLARLTIEEKQLLQSYAKRHTRTRRWNLGSGVVQGLVQAGILFRSSNAGSIEEGFAYSMEPWAYEHVLNHPDLIETPTTSMEPDAFP